MRRTLCLMLMMPLTTFAPAQAGIGAERALSSTESNFIQDAVRARMLDPQSAQFRMNKYRLGSLFYCGIVNAKNRMGGYTGYQPFVLRLVEDDSVPRPAGPITSYTTVVMDRGDSEGLMTRAITDRCTREGYRTSY